MEAKFGVKVLKELRLNGKIATLRQARKAHTCADCGLPIAKGTYYYEVVYAGSGLGSLKFPERNHIECLEKGGEYGSRDSNS